MALKDKVNIEENAKVGQLVMTLVDEESKSRYQVKCDLLVLQKNWV